VVREEKTGLKERQEIRTGGERKRGGEEGKKK